MRNLAALMFLLAGATACLAQSNATDSALEGYVKDPAGAVIAQSRVTARNTGTNSESTTETNGQGYYRFPLLPIGTYDVTVSAPGFADYRQAGVVLNVGRQVRVDVQLSVASAQQTVEVQADASIVDTSRVSVEEVVNERAVRSLPIVSRNVYNYNLLGPGVKGVPSSGFGTTQFTFGGLNRSAWNVDGMDNTQRRFSRQIRLVINTPEAIQEVQVVSNGFSAEFGRAAGGLINTITRSGTNDYHGSGMFLYRPEDTNARPPLAATRPSQEWKTTAGTFGGPIRKDRLFFLAQYEWNPLVLPNPVTIAPANAQALSLSASELTPVPFGEEFHTAMGKVNFRLSDRHSGFVRYSRFTNDSPYNGGGGLTIGSRSLVFTDRMNGGAAQLASVLSPNLLNEFRFGVNRRSEVREQLGSPRADDAFVNILGVANLGNNPLANNTSIETSAQFINNTTWTRGRQTLKGGVDFQTTGFDQIRALTRTFAFNGLPAVAGVRPAVTPLTQYLNTIGGATDPATGRPYTYTQLQQDLGDPNIAKRFHFLNLFAQDEVRLTQRLQLNFGVRYERIFYPVLDEEAPYERSRRVPGDGNNIAPRVGFSWSPFADSGTVVRGGYGLFYDTPSLGLMLDGALLNGRRIFSFALPGADPLAPAFPRLLTTVDPSRATPPNVTAFSPDFQTMVAHQANLQVERELLRDFSLNVQYQYAGARNGAYARDINLGTPVARLADGRPQFVAANRPDARFRAINLVESAGTSNYHALDVTLRKRFSRGLQFSTTWSWSKALSDSDFLGVTQGTNALTDPTNRRFDYGPSPTDVRHNLVLQGLYAPTFRAAAARWVNGFEFASMLFYNSGRPINVQAGVDLNGDLVLNDRPLFRGRNDTIGPDFLQWDVRVTRRFRFQERYSVDLIAESENLLNRFNPNCSIDGCTGAVVNRFGASDFGRVISARQARVFQFGGRFSF